MEQLRTNFSDAFYKYFLESKFGFEACVFCEDKSLLLEKFEYANWQELKKILIS